MMRSILTLSLTILVSGNSVSAAEDERGGFHLLRKYGSYTCYSENYDWVKCSEFDKIMVVFFFPKTPEQHVITGNNLNLTSKADGTVEFSEPKKADPSQLWKIESLSNGRIRYQSSNGKCLGIGKKDQKLKLEDCTVPPVWKAAKFPTPPPKN